jgi:hypothetical protein
MYQENCKCKHCKTIRKQIHKLYEIHEHLIENLKTSYENDLLSLPTYQKAYFESNANLIVKINELKGRE